ncbi:MAG: MotA/TolQ/ExbB proton channel family protein [Porticoccus sp.]|nr:MotA/TolQ/ExbB proton channel family protein [Porticoccus sp.]PCJ90427.1 MAG: biopolymer transporter ExbB [Porticoccaceae bacterium]
MYELVIAGGWLMLPIILSSVVMIAIAIERYWSLRPSKVVPPTLLGQVWHWLKQNQLTKENIHELRGSSALGSILAAGISNSGHGREVMKDSIEEAAVQVVHSLEKHLVPLGTIAAVTPLLGLLGTVIGMIKVFTAIMIEGTGNAGVLAGGISEALITTAAGLSVAIPALIIHKYFERRVDSLVVEMEDQAIKLIDALHGDRVFRQDETQSKEVAAA